MSYLGLRYVYECIKNWDDSFISCLLSKLVCILYPAVESDLSIVPQPVRSDSNVFVTRLFDTYKLFQDKVSEYITVNMEMDKDK